MILADPADTIVKELSSLKSEVAKRSILKLSGNQENVLKFFLLDNEYKVFINLIIKLLNEIHDCEYRKSGQNTQSKKTISLSPYNKTSLKTNSLLTKENRRLINANNSVKTDEIVTTVNETTEINDIEDYITLLNDVKFLFNFS